MADVDTKPEARVARPIPSIWTGAKLIICMPINEDIVQDEESGILTEAADVRHIVAKALLIPHFFIPINKRQFCIGELAA